MSPRPTEVAGSVTLRLPRVRHFSLTLLDEGPNCLDFLIDNDIVPTSIADPTLN